jgi:hypothetical protein
LRRARWGAQSSLPARWRSGAIHVDRVPQHDHVDDQSERTELILRAQLSWGEADVSRGPAPAAASALPARSVDCRAPARPACGFRKVGREPIHVVSQRLRPGAPQTAEPDFLFCYYSDPTTHLGKRDQSRRHPRTARLIPHRHRRRHTRSSWSAITSISILLPRTVAILPSATHIVSFVLHPSSAWLLG